MWNVVCNLAYNFVWIYEVLILSMIVTSIDYISQWLKFLSPIIWCRNIISQSIFLSTLKIKSTTSHSALFSFCCPSLRVRKKYSLNDHEQEMDFIFVELMGYCDGALQIGSITSGPTTETNPLVTPLEM